MIIIIIALIIIIIEETEDKKNKFSRFRSFWIRPFKSKIFFS